MAAPIGPATAKPTTPPPNAPSSAFSDLACFRFSTDIGARVFPFQPRAVRLVLALSSRLHEMQAGLRLLR